MTSPSFDLLLDTAVSIPLPTLSSAAQGCYTVSWNIYRQSDDADMEATLGSVFTIVGDTHLAVSHDVSDYAQRLALFASGSNYYFVGTVSDATPASTS